MSDNKPTSVTLRDDLLVYLNRAIKDGVTDGEGAVQEVPASLVNAAINFLKQFPPDAEEDNRLKAQEQSEILAGAHPAVTRKFEPKVVKQ